RHRRVGREGEVARRSRDERADGHRTRALRRTRRPARRRVQRHQDERAGGVSDEASLLVEKARARRPLVEREAARAEEETTTTQVVVDALAEAELFWILVPRELGGAEAGIEDALAVFEELAYADGSTGWSTMANATSSAFAAIYTGDDAAK